MTHEEFMRMYSNSLEHGWVSSKDPQKAAEQKRREQEYNKEYYRTHKASPGQAQRDRARENFRVGVNAIKDATSNAWKNFNSALDSMSEEQAKAWKNHKENYNTGMDAIKDDFNRYKNGQWKNHQENYNRGMDTLTGKNNRSSNSIPQNQLRARESAAMTKSSRQNRQRVLNTVNEKAKTEKARLTPIGKIKGAVTKGSNFVRSKFDRFKNAYKNATTQKSTNDVDGYKFNGNYKTSNGQTQDFYTRSFNPFMAIDAIVSHYKYD